MPETGWIGLPVAKGLAGTAVDVLEVDETEARVTMPSTSKTINPRLPGAAGKAGSNVGRVAVVEARAAAR